MPYITFSRNVKNPRIAKKILEKTRANGNSVIVLRGRKSIDQVVRDALARGFATVLIVQSSSRAIEIKLNPGNPSEWAYGRTIVMK